MSPAGAAPYVPVVAPAASLSASARALAGSRLTTSTVYPALAARPPIAAAMPPEPMMLIVLMFSCLVKKADAEREAGVLDGVGDEAQRQQGGRSAPAFAPWAGARYPSGQSEALDERRDACLRLRVVAGEEHIQRVALDWTGSQDVGELGVERLDHNRIGRGGLGDLLRAGTVLRGHEVREVSVDGVGDVDEELACQRFAVLLHHVENGGVGNRQDDDVPGRGGAERSCRRTGADLLGQRPRLRGIATRHLDGVSGLDGKAADRCGDTA